MAKKRLVDTFFWDDKYIRGLDPLGKLLYLYFLTSPLTNICGIYEVTVERVAFDTGIDKDMVKQILKRFRNNGKVRYKDGYIAIKNFIKSQVDNPKIRAGISYELNTKPQSLVDFVDTLDCKPTERKFKRVKVSKTLRKQIFKKFPKCCFCGAVDNLEIDHIIPIYEGGTNDEENLRVLCQSCNGKRNAGLRWDKNTNGWTMGSPSHLNTNINFNYDKGKFEGITDEFEKELSEKYPGTNVRLEIDKMCNWLLDNPKKKRQGKRSFIHNWLKRANANYVETENYGVPRLKQGGFSGK